MCGIAGYIGKKRFDTKEIKRILDTMKRRGPDASGFKEILFKKKYISVFFSRLSITDPKNTKANQPYIFKDKMLIFNGEIYNYLSLKKELITKGYRFETNSDTEVLIKVLDFWGENGIKKLEGMWSFYLYDSTKQTGILCRDRFGEKPLFYYNDNNEFIFSSEIKTIQKILDKKLKINNDKIDELLRFGYKSLYKDHKTYFDKIVNFPKGTYFLLKNNKIIQKKYWQIKYEPNSFTEKKTIHKIKDSLFKSIELRLRSDVPLAFLLSGGLDSNSLAFISKKYFNYDVNTFSIINKEKRYDESYYINFAKNELKSNHFQLKPDFKKNEFFSKLTNQIKYHDQPVTTINSFFQFLLLKEISKSGYKVVVSGLGADEIFSGYYDHHLLYLNEIKNNKNLFKKSVKNWHDMILPFTRNPYLQKYDLFIKNKKFRKHIYQAQTFKENMFIKKKLFRFKEDKYCASLMKNRMINELTNEIIPNGLKEDDLNAMYSSIENRSPYLDSNLFQDCLNMPSKNYIQNGMAKWPLRKIVEGLVPDKIRLKKEKVGFNANISDAIDLTKKKDRDFLLEDGEIFKIINKKSFEKLISKKRAESGVESNFLFTFISSKIFMENFS
ncbi:asparagine synthase (glutamine-hydrolyzing) [Candidatus Pelagibacter sp.]|nr:asparagine synthase (glutamine-hydrolyzing) [Candidatus Pelagibacter sp.]